MQNVKFLFGKHLSRERGVSGDITLRNHQNPGKVSCHLRYTAKYTLVQFYSIKGVASG